MNTINIARTDHFSYFRTIAIEVNGHTYWLKFKESVEIPVEGDEWTLRAKLDWCCSPTLVSKETEIDNSTQYIGVSHHPMISRSAKLVFFCILLDVFYPMVFLNILTVLFSLPLIFGLTIYRHRFLLLTAEDRPVREALNLRI